MTGQRQAQTFGRYAHLSLHDLFVLNWRNLRLPRSFMWSNVLVNFFKYLSTEFAACSKPRSRDNHRKAYHPKTQERHQGADWTGSCTKSRKTKIRIGQNPKPTKSRIGQNPELDKNPNWTISRTDKIPNWTKSRMDKIPNWTKSRNGLNLELD